MIIYLCYSIYVTFPGFESARDTVNNIYQSLSANY